MALPKLNFKQEDLECHLEKKVELINEFEKLKLTYNTDWKIAYIDKIIDEIDNLLIGNLNNLLNLKNTFLLIKDLRKGNCNKRDCNCKVCNDFKENQIFSNKIQDIFNYSNSSLRAFYTNSNIKACYVCNAQYTLAIQSEYDKKKYKSIKKFKNSSDFVKQVRFISKYQLDHYIPKSLFPAFSVSLHNLYPICSNCNQIKSNKSIDLKNLYSDITFELEPDSIRKYYLGEGNFELKINCLSPDTRETAESFDFKGIYNNHLDYIEEVFERKIKYTNSYKESLEKQFENIKYINKQNIEDRLILGTYSLEEGYYKRPLSKFIHDINNQFDNLIK